MKWTPKECRPGDIIRIRLGTIYHYGIFVSEDEVIAFGYPPIPAYRDKGEVVVLATDIDVFSCGNIVETAELNLKEKLKRRSPAKTVELARQRLGEGGYNLIHNNCEHFVNEVVFGVKYSEQEELARQRWARYAEKNQP